MRIIGKARLRRALYVTAVTWLVVGPVAAQEVAPSGEQKEPRKRSELFLEGAYVVQEGDTLWAIAGRYLDNPREWPQIWKENAFVTNPNLIFPGDPLYIPGVTPPPKPVAEAPAVPPVAEERVVPPIAPPVEAVPPTEVVEAKKPEEAIKVPVAPPVLAIPRQSLECSGFVAENREIHAVGAIVRPLDKDSLRLWYGDHVFLDFGGRKVQPGDRFQIIRPVGRVRHPVRGGSVGVKVQTLGTVEVVSTVGASPRGMIVYNCEDIAVGDYLVEEMKWEAPQRGVGEPTDIRVNGYIVGSKSDADSLARGDIVYVDVGQEKGIVPGDEFSIFRMSGVGKSPTGRMLPLAPVKEGELIVLRTFAKSGVALLTKSALNLRTGEPILLHRKMP